MRKFNMKRRYGSCGGGSEGGGSEGVGGERGQK